MTSKHPNVIFDFLLELFLTLSGITNQIHFSNLITVLGITRNIELKLSAAIACQPCGQFLS